MQVRKLLTFHTPPDSCCVTVRSETSPDFSQTSPDFVDVVLLQGLALAAGDEDAVRCLPERGQVHVRLRPDVPQLVGQWLATNEWQELVCIPLQWELRDLMGSMWQAEIEVGSEKVISDRAERLTNLTQSLSWTVPDVPPARIIYRDLDLALLATVI